MKTTWITESVPTTVTVLGKEVSATYRIGYQYEDEPVEGSFDFGDEEDNAAYLADFESGKLTSLVAVAEAYVDGYKGTDYLGQCHVLTATAEKDLEALARDHGMPENALDDAKAGLLRCIENAKKYLGTGG